MSVGLTLQAKIEKLLDGIVVTGFNTDDADDLVDANTNTTLPPLHDERILTALVLYTRLDLSDDTYCTDSNNMEKFWRSHGDVLVPWMEELVQPFGLDTENDEDNRDCDNAGTTNSIQQKQEFHRLYMRLVAQVLLSVVSSTDNAISDFVPQTVIEPLGTALMKVWNEDNDDDESSSTTMVHDPDILAGICGWLARRVDDMERWTENDTVFRQLVERLMMNHEYKNPKKERIEPDSQQANKENPVPETLMIQTLSTLLDQNSPFCNSDKKLFSLTDCLEQTGLSILICQHCQRTPENRIPSFFRPLLEWWVVQQKSNNHHGARSRVGWARVLLLSTLELAKNVNAKLRLQQSDLSLLTKVLLACVVSISPPTTTAAAARSISGSKNNADEELRTLAWSTGALLTETYGWDYWFILTSGSSSSSNHNNKHPLGHASQLCAWLRLAAGEWRIQLGWFLTMDAKNDISEGNDDIFDSCSSSDRIRIVQACAHILVQGLQYMTQVADEIDIDHGNDSGQDNKPPLLSADAICHIQKSLQETLHSTVEYLGETTASMDDSKTALMESVIFVLGNLLSEINAFDMIPSSMNALNENDILQALASALKYDCSISAQEHLLPGLATVFASSEGDVERIHLLKEYGLTGKTLEEYFTTYFRRTNNLESLTWACQLVDLWTSSVTVDTGDRLLDSVLSCLQRLLSTKVAVNELGMALSSTVACYVTLKGDEPPNDKDAQIIQHAMQRSSGLGVQR